jgi:hypothetical protein
MNTPTDYHSTEVFGLAWRKDRDSSAGVIALTYPHFMCDLSRRVSCETCGSDIHLLLHPGRGPPAVKGNYRSLILATPIQACH